MTVSPRPPSPFREKDPLELAETQDGMSLLALSRLGPLLVVCLPASPRRWLERVAAERRAIEEAGGRIALVHRDERAVEEIRRCGLEYLARVADPGRAVYRALKLGEGGGGLWARLRGTAGERLPGAVVLRDGAERAAFRPASAGAPPDGAALIREALRAPA